MPNPHPKPPKIRLPDHPIFDLPTKDKPPNWLCTVSLLEAYGRSYIILSQPATQITHFWDMLDWIDLTHTLRSRIDRKTFESTPRAHWKTFWNLYFTAVITGMLRKTGLLESYEAYNLVVLQPKPGTEMYTSTRESGDYTKTFPALAPLEAEMPSLNCEYLEILEAHIQYELELKGFLPNKKTTEKGIAAAAEKIMSEFGFEGLFNATQDATNEYFGKHVGEARRAVALSSGGVPFVFMWHVLLGHYDEMIRKLLLGSGMKFVPKLRPEYLKKADMKAAKVPDARKFRTRYKNN